MEKEGGYVPLFSPPVDDIQLPAPLPLPSIPVLPAPSYVPLFEESIPTDLQPPPYHPYESSSMYLPIVNPIPSNPDTREGDLVPNPYDSDLAHLIAAALQPQQSFDQPNVLNIEKIPNAYAGGEELAALIASSSSRSPENLAYPLAPSIYAPVVEPIPQQQADMIYNPYQGGEELAALLSSTQQQPRVESERVFNPYDGGEELAALLTSTQQPQPQNIERVHNPYEGGEELAALLAPTQQQPHVESERVYNPYEGGEELAALLASTQHPQPHQQRVESERVFNPYEGGEELAALLASTQQPQQQQPQQQQPRVESERVFNPYEGGEELASLLTSAQEREKGNEREGKEEEDRTPYNAYDGDGLASLLSALPATEKLKKDKKGKAGKQKSLEELVYGASPDSGIPNSAYYKAYDPDSDSSPFYQPDASSKPKKGSKSKAESSRGKEVSVITYKTGPSQQKWDEEDESEESDDEESRGQVLDKKLSIITYKTKATQEESDDEDETDDEEAKGYVPDKKVSVITYKTKGTQKDDDEDESDDEEAKGYVPDKKVSSVITYKTKATQNESDEDDETDDEEARGYVPDKKLSAITYKTKETRKANNDEDETDDEEARGYVPDKKLSAITYKTGPAQKVSKQVTNGDDDSSGYDDDDTDDEEARGYVPDKKLSAITYKTGPSQEKEHKPAKKEKPKEKEKEKGKEKEKETATLKGKKPKHKFDGKVLKLITTASELCDTTQLYLLSYKLKEAVATIKEWDLGVLMAQLREKVEAENAALNQQLSQLCKVDSACWGGVYVKAVSVVQANLALVRQVENIPYLRSSPKDASILNKGIKASIDETLKVINTFSNFEVLQTNTQSFVSWAAYANIDKNGPGGHGVETLRCLSKLSMERGNTHDWNKEFQDMIDIKPSKSEEERQRANRLGELAVEFVSKAKKYAKIIISEAPLPYKEKTIKPIDIGGKAGGMKFIHMGIFFKFASDWEGLYGSDEYSMKAAALELNALAYVDAIKASYKNIRLCVPLMILIDELGYRMVCVSILPIDDSTLVYGSSNAGRTMKKSNEEFNKIMRLVGKQLNLRQHIAGFGPPSKIYGPCDIEGHIGKDGRYYLLDFPRLFPPTGLNPKHPKGFLYQLFRPEFVINYRKDRTIDKDTGRFKEDLYPLSSDALSIFAARDPDYRKHNQDVAMATQHMFEECEELGKWAVQSRSKIAGSIASLHDEMHRRGINVRYMGRVLCGMEDNMLRGLMLQDMLARTAKNILRQRLRDNVHNALYKDPKALIADYLNLLLGNAEPSKTFWEKQLIPKMHLAFPLPDGVASYYPYARKIFEEIARLLPFDVKEDDPRVYLPIACAPIFVDSLCHRFGMKLSNRILLELAAISNDYKHDLRDPSFMGTDLGILTAGDIEKISTRVKQIPIVDELIGRAAFLNAQAICERGRKLDRSGLHRVNHYLTQAAESYGKAIAAISGSNINSVLALIEVYIDQSIYGDSRASLELIEGLLSAQHRNSLLSDSSTKQRKNIRLQVAGLCCDRLCHWNRKDIAHHTQMAAIMRFKEMIEKEYPNPPSFDTPIAEEAIPWDPRLELVDTDLFDLMVVPFIEQVIEEALIPPVKTLEGVIDAILVRTNSLFDEAKKMKTDLRSPLLWGCLLFCTHLVLKSAKSVLEAAVRPPTAEELHYIPLPRAEPISIPYYATQHQQGAIPQYGSYDSMIRSSPAPFRSPKSFRNVQFLAEDKEEIEKAKEKVEAELQEVSQECEQQSFLLLRHVNKFAQPPSIISNDMIAYLPHQRDPYLSMQPPSHLEGMY